MAAKKCNCKKCGYCKQICTGTPIFRTNCEVYGEIYMPNYCDKFITIQDYEIQQRVKEDYDRQMKHLEYVWTIVNKREGK